MFYVYVHYRKSDNLPFYVGKGSGNRYTETQGRNRYWNKVAKKHGFYSVLWYTGLTEQDAFVQEKQLISDFRSVYGKRITNISDGGEGFSRSAQVKARQRKLEQWLICKNRLPRQYEPTEVALFRTLHECTDPNERSHSDTICRLADLLGRRYNGSKNKKQEILEYYLDKGRWPEETSNLGVCFRNYVNPSGTAFDPSFYAMYVETRTRGDK